MSLNILNIWGLVTPLCVSRGQSCWPRSQQGQAQPGRICFLDSHGQPDIAFDLSGFVAQLFVCNLKDEKQGTTPHVGRIGICPSYSY